MQADYPQVQQSGYPPFQHSDLTTDMAIQPDYPPTQANHTMMAMVVQPEYHYSADPRMLPNCPMQPGSIVKTRGTIKQRVQAYGLIAVLCCLRCTVLFHLQVHAPAPAPFSLHCTVHLCLCLCFFRYAALCLSLQVCLRLRPRLRHPLLGIFHT